MKRYRRRASRSSAVFAIGSQDIPPPGFYSLILGWSKSVCGAAIIFIGTAVQHQRLGSFS
jgi:hypothetical protein